MRFVLHQVKGLAHFYFIQATLVETCSPAFEEGKNRESQSRCVPTDPGSSISFNKFHSRGLSFQSSKILVPLVACYDRRSFVKN